jgi:hypothetical protein
MNTSAILADAKSILDDTIQLRRRIHRQPEVGLSVPRTQATVLEALEGLGRDVRTGQRTTSIVARTRFIGFVEPRLFVNTSWTPAAPVGLGSADATPPHEAHDPMAMTAPACPATSCTMSRAVRPPIMQ